MQENSKREMKKLLMYGLLLGGGALTSCQYTEMIGPTDPVDPRNRETRVQITIEAPNAGMTRTIVGPEDNETDVENLHLLFFEYSVDGSGKLVQDYEVGDADLTCIDNTPFKLEIGSAPGQELSHLEHYSIVAYANIATLPGALIPGMTTEKDVRDRIQTYNTGTKFEQGLPMSGTTTKEPEQELVELKLTRLVVRFDVQNLLDDYQLVSVSIWNAPTNTWIWDSKTPDDREALPVGGTSHTNGKAYGLTESEIAAQNNEGNVYGGLYSFENFIGDPAADQDHTTALIVGLKGNANTPSSHRVVKYFRVDIHPDGEGQSLKKNHVYQLSLKGITGVGEDSEEAAAENTQNPPDKTINNWGFDEEGLILNDGTNMLVAPSRLIKFGPEAESREYLIYTSGTGTLEISRRNLPNGITATLSGNTLTVSVTDLPDPVDGYQEERAGDIELGFVGLRGTIQILQSPRDDKFLYLNKKSLKLWPAVGPAEQASIGVSEDNVITVSASGNWTARIYNTSESANPGFTFNPSGAVNAAADLQQSGAPGGTLTVYPSGANPGNNVRQGFILVSLDDDKKYRQVLVMLQEGMPKIEIYPAYDSIKGLPFDAGGFAKLGNGSGRDKFYRVEVRPGKNPDGTLRAWEASLSGSQAAFFKLTKIEDPVAPYIVISANGQNNDSVNSPNFNFGGPLDALLTVEFPGGSVENQSAIQLPVRQDPLAFKLSRIGERASVPTTGAMVRTKVWKDDVKRDDYTMRNDGYRDYVEYRVDLPASLRWKAEIVGQSLPSHTSTEAYKWHEGYLIDGNDNKVTSMMGRTPENTLRVGFDMIYYPLIQYDGDPETTNRPEVTIKISVEGASESDVAPVVVSVTQEPLKPKTLEMIIGSVSLTDDVDYGAMVADDSYYLDQFRIQLMDNSNFGPSGTVKMVRAPRNSYVLSRVDTWMSNVPVEPTRNYVHASAHHPGPNWTEAAYTAVENWRRNPVTQGMALFTGLDDANDNDATALRPFIQQSTLAKLGWKPVLDNGANTRDVTRFYPGDTQTRVMKYIGGVKGPFGSMPNHNDTWSDIAINIGGLDGAHCSLDRSTLGPNAVVILTGEGDPDKVLVAIDPVARVAFIGDVVQFNTPYVNSAEEMTFLKNFLAILMNGAQYGEHFLELLKEDCPMPLYLPDGTLVDPAP